MTPLLLTVTQAAKVLGIGRSTAYELIAAGELDVVRIGCSSRVPVVALEEFVERLRATRSVGTLVGPASVRRRLPGDPADGRPRSQAE